MTCVWLGTGGAAGTAIGVTRCNGGGATGRAPCIQSTTSDPKYLRPEGSKSGCETIFKWALPPIWFTNRLTCIEAVGLGH